MCMVAAQTVSTLTINWPFQHCKTLTGPTRLIQDQCNVRNTLNLNERDEKYNYVFLLITERLLTYLRCTQVGGLKVTSDFALGVFPEERITEDYQVQFCQDVLGDQYNHQALHRAVAELNFIYGGQDQIITHVVFSNAGLNPLLHFGIAEYDQIYSEVVFLTCTYILR